MKTFNVTLWSLVNPSEAVDQEHPETFRKEYSQTAPTKHIALMQAKDKHPWSVWESDVEEIDINSAVIEFEEYYVANVHKVNYQKMVEGELIEITGYFNELFESFEPNEENEYFDENWEDITIEITNNFLRKC